ncbi:hypothetical protein [Lamprocystis purpurea]|uniref:hypothetical protein n=1 Tax=Lamprocystis purpurea TaxID=61598 RepID=UPI0038992277
MPTQVLLPSRSTDGTNVRARASEPTATALRELLAALECRRWEYGRPADEPRHRDSENGAPWTDALT